MKIGPLTNNSGEISQLLVPLLSSLQLISGWDFQWKLVTSKCVWSFPQYAVQYLVEDHFIYWMRYSCQAGPRTGLYYVTAAVSDDEEHSWNRMIQPICGGALHQSSHTLLLIQSNYLVKTIWGNSKIFFFSLFTTVRLFRKKNWNNLQQQFFLTRAECRLVQ